MDDRPLDLTEAQEAVKSKYPPIDKKYECKFGVLIDNLASSTRSLLLVEIVVETPFPVTHAPVSTPLS